MTYFNETAALDALNTGISGNKVELRSDKLTASQAGFRRQGSLGMRSAVAARKVALIVGAAAIMSSGALAACAKEKPAETKPSSSTSAPAVSETEKAPGSFKPPVKAKPAPSALPGNERAGLPGNVKTG